MIFASSALAYAAPMRKVLGAWALAALALAAPAAAEQPLAPQPLAFWPQAGILGRDLFTVNYVDLDDATGSVRTWDCGANATDGHNGEDVGIRSFREKRIGVPVFAALDGKVVEVQDGFLDEHANRGSPFDNHVTVDNGNGQYTVYGHLARRSIPVRAGQAIAAGTQIGLTASSGRSTGPHLHFTEILDGRVVAEPYAGPCRPGPSDWLEQPSPPDAPYVRALTLSPQPYTGYRDLPWDEARRAAAYVHGTRTIYLRAEVGGFAAAPPLRLRVLRPDGDVALDRRPASIPAYNGVGAAKWPLQLRLDRLGTWRIQLDAGGATIADAPFEVVARAAQVVNRAPAPVQLELAPTAPRGGDVVFCRVRTSLVTRDPDYDVVRYR